MATCMWWTQSAPVPASAWETASPSSVLPNDHARTHAARRIPFAGRTPCFPLLFFLFQVAVGRNLGLQSRVGGRRDGDNLRLGLRPPWVPRHARVQQGDLRGSQGGRRAPLRGQGAPIARSLVRRVLFYCYGVWGFVVG